MASVMRWIFVAMLLLWLPTTSHAQNCSAGTKSIYGKALLNHPYQEVKALHLGDCVIKCIQDHGRKCQSTNWNMGTNVCELNDAKYEDHPRDLVDRWSTIYMTSIVLRSNTNNNTNITKKDQGAPAGNSKKSCKEILASSQSKGSGEYLIDPENTGTTFKVYCDMTTDGGGWILIKNYTLTQPVQTFSSDPVKSTSYRDISNYNKLDHYLRLSDLYKLRTLIGATQLRWYCYKKSHSRVFHVMTNSDAVGQKVLEYFTKSAVKDRPSCGSFTALPDDTSELSKNCNSWGKDEFTDSVRAKKWSWDVKNDMRIFRTVVRWESNYAVGLFINQYDCDDHYDSSKSTVNNGDKWLVYIR